MSSKAGTLAKTKFIKKYGTSIKIRRYVSGSFEEHASFALLGRGSRTNSTMRLLESLREGIFTHDAAVDSGYFVENAAQNEVFIIGGTQPEYGVNGALAVVANLLLCNSSLTIRGQKQVADGRGNLKTQFTTSCQDLPCYVQEVTSELRQYDAGLLPDTDYLIYSTAIDVLETDQLLLSVRGNAESFKVLARDYVSYPNMVVLQVSRDIRK